MHTVQMDTGDLILGLRGLTRKDGEASPREETYAAIELCNNLILYRTIFYDGRVVKVNLDEIQALQEKTTKAIENEETRELCQNKLQPIELEEETESKAIRGSATDTIKPLSVIDQMADTASTNPLYLQDPFGNLATILKFFEQAKAPGESSIRNLYEDRKIRGGRFFWAILQEECFDAMKEYLGKHKGNESRRLRILFARFRYRFAVHRGEEMREKDPEPNRSLDYQPEEGRQKMMAEFGDCLEQATSKEIELELMRQIYPDGSAAVKNSGDWVYVRKKTNIPLLVNRALLPLSKRGQYTRGGLVRECLELSQENSIEQIWNALDTYSSADEGKQREIREMMCDFAKTQSDPLVSGSRVLEAIKKVKPLEVLKELLAKTIADDLSATRHAATILGRSVQGLATKLEVLNSVQEVFGSIPKA